MRSAQCGGSVRRSSAQCGKLSAQSAAAEERGARENKTHCCSAKKVYLENTNLSAVLAADNPNDGNQRETFFMNQTKVSYQPSSSSLVDFSIYEYHFEIGGKNKSQKQLQQQANGFVVKDKIEQGYLNVIPLWHFGFLY